MLQKNERLVLQHLVENGRITDSAIAEQIGITTQAVGKIRHKLEAEGIIRGYAAQVNHEAIGLPIVTIIAVVAPPHVIACEDNFRKRIVTEPSIIYCHRMTHGGAHFLMGFTFHNVEEKEQYFEEFSALFPELKIVNTQTSTWDTVWKSGMRGAIIHTLKGQRTVAFEGKPCGCKASMAKAKERRA